MEAKEKNEKAKKILSCYGFIDGISIMSSPEQTHENMLGAMQEYAEHYASKSTPTPFPSDEEIKELCTKCISIGFTENPDDFESRLNKVMKEFRDTFSPTLESGEKMTISELKERESELYRKENLKEYREGVIDLAIEYANGLQSDTQNKQEGEALSNFEFGMTEIEKAKELTGGWIDILNVLPPKHDLVLTISSGGRIEVSRFVSNDFPNDCKYWREIPPKPTTNDKVGEKPMDKVNPMDNFNTPFCANKFSKEGCECKKSCMDWNV